MLNGIDFNDIDLILLLIYLCGISGFIASFLDKKIKRKLFTVIILLSSTFDLISVVIENTLIYQKDAIAYQENAITYNVIIWEALWQAILALVIFGAFVSFFGGIIGLIVSLFRRKIKRKPFVLIIVISAGIFIISTIVVSLTVPLISLCLTQHAGC
jgi:hypothetical protein